MFDVCSLKFKNSTTLGHVYEKRGNISGSNRQKAHRFESIYFSLLKRNLLAYFNITTYTFDLYIINIKI